MPGFVRDSVPPAAAVHRDVFDDPTGFDFAIFDARIFSLSWTMPVSTITRDPVPPLVTV